MKHLCWAQLYSKPLSKTFSAKSPGHSYKGGNRLQLGHQLLPDGRSYTLVVSQTDQVLYLYLSLFRQLGWEVSCDKLQLTPPQTLQFIMAFSSLRNIRTCFNLWSMLVCPLMIRSTGGNACSCSPWLKIPPAMSILSSASSNL